MTYINNYKFIIFTKILLFLIGSVGMLVIFAIVNSFGSFKAEPNKNAIEVLFILSIVFFLLGLVYQIYLIIQDYRKPVIVIQTQINYKWFIPSIFKLGRVDFYIRTRDVKFGFIVTFSIFSNFHQGDNVEITYLPASRLMVSIRKL